MARRKATKKRSTAKKGATCPKKGARVKIGGKYYTVKGYSKTKTGAKKDADAHRAKGKKKYARVRKTSCGHQVLVRG